MLLKRTQNPPDPVPYLLGASHRTSQVAFTLPEAYTKTCSNGVVPDSHTELVRYSGRDLGHTASLCVPEVTVSGYHT